MGCVGLKGEPRYVSTPAGTTAPPPSDKIARYGSGVSSASTSSLEPGMDDLGWVPSSSSGDIGAPSAPRPAFVIEEVVVASRRKRLPLRVQVLLEDGWKDVSEEETRQVCKYLGNGELNFTMHARGQNYVIDFEAAEGVTQLNVSTGRRRSLRILDNTEDDDCEPCGGGSGLGRSSSSSALPPDIKQQLEYGPQSKRGGASDHPFRVLNGNDHAKECFRAFEQNEAKLCGEWAVFYHSYSFAALIYEVQAAVGSVLFRFRSQYAPLPRLLVKDFQQIPDAPELVRRFQTEFATSKRDHHPSFRRVAVSAMCSLSSTGPEACTAMVFIAGYSCKDLSFRSVLENLLESCYVPRSKVKSLAEKIIALSEKHGLDVSQFGGKACESGKAGHLLQIFIRRPLVDRFSYAAMPYGPIDEARMPISKWMNSNQSFQVGQARVVAHPKFFMRADCIRMYVASADPTFHANRKEFQKELVGLLSMILGQPELRQKAASSIYGGCLPSWWSAEDQRKHERY